jgi:hypothetical protein
MGIPFVLMVQQVWCPMSVGSLVTLLFLLSSTDTNAFDPLDLAGKDALCALVGGFCLIDVTLI